MAQYTVLHVSKGKGISPGLTKHILRLTTPENANPELARLNIHYDYSHLGDSLGNRADKVIEKAGLSRKVRKDAVKFNPIIISGSQQTMIKIRDTGKLAAWTSDVFNFVATEFGEENIIAFSMHADEISPHVHAVIVPIVKNEIATDFEAQRKIKRKKKMNMDNVRLSSKILFSPERLVGLQDRIATAMQKWKLVRGLKGSKAKHTTVAEFYKKLNNPVITEIEAKENTSLFGKTKSYTIDKETLESLLISSKGQSRRNKELNEKLEDQIKRLSEFEKGRLSPNAALSINQSLKQFGLFVTLDGKINREPKKQDNNDKNILKGM